MTFVRVLILSRNKKLPGRFHAYRTLVLIACKWWYLHTSNNLRRQPVRTRTHYNDVIMGTIASQITSLAIVYSTIYLGADQRKASNAQNVSIWWRHHIVTVSKIYAYHKDHLRVVILFVSVHNDVLITLNMHMYDMDERLGITRLSQWGRDKMADISLTTFSSAFSWMEICEFRLKKFTEFCS